VNSGLIDSLLVVVESHPDDVPLRVHLAELLLAAGRREEAIAQFGLALARDPANAAARAGMAQAIGGRSGPARAGCVLGRGGRSGGIRRGGGRAVSR
jgi:predicted Zn-dependent protease